MTAKRRPVEKRAVSGNLRRRSQASSKKRARCGQHELGLRLDTVEGWLAERRPRSEIVELCRQQWGCSPRQADRYIEDATKRSLARDLPGRDENRRQHIATVKALIPRLFQTGNLRGVVPAIRLLAELDGSLCEPPSHQGVLGGLQPPKQLTAEEWDREMRIMRTQLDEHEKLQGELAATRSEDVIDAKPATAKSPSRGKPGR